MYRISSEILAFINCAYLRHIFWKHGPSARFQHVFLHFENHEPRLTLNTLKETPVNIFKP